MKRAAILVLAIATLVMIVSPSAYPLASSTYPTKSGYNTPSVVAPATGLPAPGPSNSTGGGTGGGSDQGDADGLSGLKIKPLSHSGLAASSGRIAISLMLWWRYMLLIR
jgi:hypothetical protein